MKRVKIGLLAIITLLVIIIVFQNTQAVETKLLFASVTMPRALLLFVALLIGFIIGLITTNYLSKRYDHQKSKSEPAKEE